MVASIVSLTRFCIVYSVDEWLKSTDPDCEGKEQNDGKVWFHLACPTRIAKHKDGVCEAGSFDYLEDDLYKKTVKPAHSSFGVVSYDPETDSTLLVRKVMDKWLTTVVASCCWKNEF